MPTLRRDSVRHELIRGHIERPDDEPELLLWMLLLITHQITLATPCLEDHPNQLVVPAVTGRGAAKIIADLWPDRGDEWRVGYMYWFRKFGSEFGWRAVVPSSYAQQIEQLRSKLESDERVHSVVFEDEELTRSVEWENWFLPPG